MNSVKNICQNNDVQKFWVHKSLCGTLIWGQPKPNNCVCVCVERERERERERENSNGDFKYIIKSKFN